MIISMKELDFNRLTWFFIVFFKTWCSFTVDFWYELENHRARCLSMEFRPCHFRSGVFISIFFSFRFLLQFLFAQIRALQTYHKNQENGVVFSMFIYSLYGKIQIYVFVRWYHSCCLSVIIRCCFRCLLNISIYLPLLFSHSNLLIRTKIHHWLGSDLFGGCCCHLFFFFSSFLSFWDRCSVAVSLK